MRAAIFKIERRLQNEDMRLLRKKPIVAIERKREREKQKRYALERMRVVKSARER